MDDGKIVAVHDSSLCGLGGEQYIDVTPTP